MKCSSDARLAQHLVKECLGDGPLQQPVPVLAEHRRHPHHVIHIQSHKPPEQEVVIELLHKHPFAADGVEHLQQQGPQQLLRGDRGATDVGIHPLEPRRKPLQCLEVMRRIGRVARLGQIRCLDGSFFLVGHDWDIGTELDVEIEVPLARKARPRSCTCAAP